MKPSQCTKDTALKSAMVVEFHPSSKPRGNFNPFEADLGPSNNNYNDDPVVNGLIMPVTMPIELLIPDMERKVALKALLDSGYTRCLINPTLVGKRVGPEETKVPDCFLSTKRVSCRGRLSHLRPWS